jgi:hypothetical protein
MAAEKPPAEDLVEEMRKLQEGVGAANEKLARVTRYLGAATRELKDVPPEVELTPVAPAAEPTLKAEPEVE